MAQRSSSSSSYRKGMRGSLLAGLTLAVTIAAIGCSPSSPPEATTPESPSSEVASLAESLAAQQAATPDETAPEAPKAEPVTKLKIENLKKGTGAKAKNGDVLTVHYTGWLTDGTKFDSSKNSGRQPFAFPLGAQKVIPGWDKGMLGMKVGGKRKLTIPPDMGYGEQGTPGGPIPPNATLVFEVELLKIN